MDITTIDKAINNAIASLKIEGYEIDNDSIQECRRLLENEITWEEYMDIAKHKIENISSKK